MRASIETQQRLSAFLAAILPAEGFRCAIELPAKRQFFTEDLNELVRFVLEADARGLNVYHACAAYKDRGSRAKENA